MKIFILFILFILLFISTEIYATQECTQYIITDKDSVKVSFCDSNGWCKVKDKKLYIKKFLFNKTSNSTYKLHHNLSDRQVSYYYELSPKVINKYEQCMSKQSNTNILQKDTQLIYEKGLSYYKKKDFKNSYKLFSKIYKQKLMDAKFNFYYGHSAYKSGHYEMALAAFERVEMIEPNNDRIKLEMARIYFILEMYEDAQLKFKDVLKNPNIPQNVKTNISLYLAKIKSISKKSFTYTTADIELFYDSNINFGSIDDEYNIGDNIFPTQDEIASVGLQLSGNIVNVYDIGKKNNFIIKNKISLLANRYQNNPSYNINYLAYNPSLLYKTNKYLLDIELGADILSVDSKVYMKTISFKPAIDIFHNNSLKSLLYFKITDKFYATKDQNAYEYEVSYGLQKVITNQSLIIANTSYLTQHKKQGSRIDVDYDEYNINMDYINQLNQKYTLELYMEYKNRQYKDFSDLFVSVREDHAKTLSSSLNIKLKKDLNFKLKALYNKANSNQQVFSYKKYTISAGIVKIF